MGFQEGSAVCPAAPGRFSSLRLPLGVAAAFGGMSAFLCYRARLVIYPGPGDFLWALRSAQDLLAGRDPYGYPVHALAVPYPLPAAFTGLPFSWLPDPLAAALFFGLSTAFLAYGLLRDGPAWRLLLFTTPLYWHALLFAQWPPILMAMAFWPSFLFLGLVKPHMAVPLAFSGYVRWTQRGVIIALAVGAASLLVMPSWPWKFFSQLGPYEGVSPLLIFGAGGPILLIALLCWREREARLLLLMSLMPQRMFYDQLSLWLIPRSWQEMLFLTLAAWVGIAGWLHNINDWQRWIVVSIYLPALLLVMRGYKGTPLRIRRPKQSDASRKPEES